MEAKDKHKRAGGYDDPELNMKNRKRILLGQLNSMGDCLYATAIARQIKYDFPGCHLTWAIASYCRPVIDNNPYVDSIWEFEAPNKSQEKELWYRFEREALKKLNTGEFDKAFFTQIFPAHIENYDGTVRASILRGYPCPITVPINPIIELTPEEITNVKQFSFQHRLDQVQNVILFECSSSSGQSFVTPGYALKVSEMILKDVKNCKIILSSHKKIESGNPLIIDGSRLTFRENVELTKYCTFFIGCSSGISWICTSEKAKPLPMIQVLKGSTSVYASMIHDAEYFGLPLEHIIEVFDISEAQLASLAVKAIQNFKETKNLYSKKAKIRLNHYFIFVLSVMIKGFFKGGFIKGLRSFMVTYKRYGPGPFFRLLTFR